MISPINAAMPPKKNVVTSRTMLAMKNAPTLSQNSQWTNVSSGAPP